MIRADCELYCPKCSRHIVRYDEPCPNCGYPDKALTVCHIIYGYCQGDSSGHMRYFARLLKPIVDKEGK